MDPMKLFSNFSNLPIPLIIPMYISQNCDTTYDETDVDNADCDTTVSLTTFLMEPMQIFRIFLAT